MDPTDIVVYLLIAVVAAYPVIFFVAYFRTRSQRKTNDIQMNTVELEAAEKALAAEAEKDWVVLKRCHGPGYTHTALSEIVTRLQSEGIDATYDVIGTSSAEGGVTNFMLMVLRGQEASALEILARLESRDPELN